MYTGPRRLAVATIAAGLAVSLAACSPSAPSGSPPPPSETSAPAPSGIDQAAIDAALAGSGTLTIWSWTPQTKAVVEEFQKAHPTIKVDLVNAGNAPDQITKLNAAIQAGSGVPDLAQLEYKALPQFALSGTITDIGPFGFDQFEGQFTKAAWSNVTVEGKLHSLPQDAGPMAMFYNVELFERLDVPVPETWDEYVDAARAIHAADPDAYIANDVGSAAFVTSMIWAAGGNPFRVEGTNVSIDLQDEGSRRFTAIWDQLIAEELLAPIPSWTDEWYTGLGNGTIGTLITGAWMPANFVSAVPAGAGKWRVAPLPTHVAGTPATAESGGSTLVIPESAENKALAAGFIRWANAGDGARFAAQNGFFPSTVSNLQDEAFLSQQPEYFGGQEIWRVLADAAVQVVPGWQFLPYQAYAESIFKDTVGQSYANRTSLNDGLVAWQEALVEYGNQQGFTVKS